jgi:hypothetical protein
MRTLMVTAALLGLLAVSPAKADLVAGGLTFTGNGTLLSLDPVVPGGNQPRNIACIICGENQPQQPTGFGYNDFGNAGNQSTINAFSSGIVRDRLADNTLGTGYDIGAGSLFLASLAGRTSFNVGFDVNDTGTAQTLESFWFLNLTQRTVLAAFSPGPGGTLVPSINNGTGFPDYTISGFDLNRGDIRPNDQIIFFARITGANDGPDSFFLVPTPTAAVPELSTWIMMILGFVGVGGIATLKRRQGEHPFRLA